jgi:hypothetical protein
MAGDWIKLEKATPFKPEMAMLAKRLNVSIAEAFLAFFRVYAWADGITATGTVPNLSPQDGDTLAGALPGTCQALASPEIGWLIVRDNAIEFVNWDRHNGTSAKQRLYEREKKRRQRTATKNSPETPGTNAGTSAGTKPGPEKRREEKSITASAVTPLPPLPKILDCDEFREALTAWLAYKGRSYKPRGLTALIGRAEKRANVHGVGAVISAMERAKGNNWEGWDQDSSFTNGSRNGHATTTVGTGQRYRGA